MKQNPIDDVLKELNFTEHEKKCFLKFLDHANTCLETGDNGQLKSKLENIITDVIKKK